MGDVGPEQSPLEAVAAMAHREATTGAPGGMVATYVELALRHLHSRHEGAWSACNVCHHGLTGPWPTATANGHAPTPEEKGDSGALG